MAAQRLITFAEIDHHKIMANLTTQFPRVRKDAVIISRLGYTYFQGNSLVIRGPASLVHIVYVRLRHCRSNCWDALLKIGMTTSALVT